MGQSYVQLASDGTGKKMDTQVTASALQHRQVMTIGDGSTDANVASVTASNALKVDNSAVTQPVSGTVTANIGTSGSLALDASVTGLQVSQGSTTSGQKGNLSLGAVTTGAPSYTTAQTSPLSLTTAGGLRVDGSAVTQPVSAASLPLPTGAATAAKQPALGTAGTAASDVITVQGIASMTPLKVDGSAVTQPVSISGNQAVNIAQVAGASTATGHGTASGSIRVELPTDGTGVVGLNAGTNLIGQVSASDETSTIYSGTTACTPTFATITASASGVTNLVALVTSKRIRVLALSLIANGTVNVKFQSHVTPTDITGLYYLVANSGFILPYNPVGWFQTVSGEALDINLSAAVAVGGTITYIAV